MHRCEQGTSQRLTTAKNQRLLQPGTRRRCSRAHTLAQRKHLSCSHSGLHPAGRECMCDASFGDRRLAATLHVMRCTAQHVRMRACMPLQCGCPCGSSSSPHVVYLRCPVGVGRRVEHCVDARNGFPEGHAVQVVDVLQGNGAVGGRGGVQVRWAMRRKAVRVGCGRGMAYLRAMPAPGQGDKRWARAVRRHPPLAPPTHLCQEFCQLGVGRQAKHAVALWRVRHEGGRQLS